MIGEVDFPINDTKKSKFSPIVNFRAKTGPLNEIQNEIYSESAHQELSEYLKKV